MITRQQWGARPSEGEGNALGQPRGVAIHWEGPQMGTRPHALCDDLVRSIQLYHQVTKGWADIAYNLMVCEHGFVFEGRGVKRGSAANGSTEANLGYHSICALVGKGDSISQALLDGIKEARQICLAAGVGKAVVGHRDLFQTECPGDALYARVRAGDFLSGVTKVVTKVKKHIDDAKSHVSSAPVLRLGSRGTGVRNLQAGLNRVFPAYSRLAVDGDFGKATDQVVREFQRRSGLGVDGVVGPKTRAAMTRAGIQL